jgi:hypothetical protein
MKYVLSLIIAFMLIGCISSPQDDLDPISSSSKVVSSSSAKKIIIQSSSSQIPIVLSSSSAQITIGDICDMAWVDVYKSRSFSSLNEFCIAYKKYLMTVIPNIKTSSLEYCIAREECTGLTEELKPRIDQICVQECQDAVDSKAAKIGMGRSSGAENEKKACINKCTF